VVEDQAETETLLVNQEVLVLVAEADKELELLAVLEYLVKETLEELQQAMLAVAEAVQELPEQVLLLAVRAMVELVQPIQLQGHLLPMVAVVVVWVIPLQQQEMAGLAEVVLAEPVPLTVPMERQIEVAEAELVETAP
jgi:hypothetical protein